MFSAIQKSLAEVVLQRRDTGPCFGNEDAVCEGDLGATPLSFIIK
jgi:hypothetical protein